MRHLKMEEPKEKFTDSPEWQELINSFKVNYKYEHMGDLWDYDYGDAKYTSKYIPTTYTVSLDNVKFSDVIYNYDYLSDLTMTNGQVIYHTSS